MTTPNHHIDAWKWYFGDGTALSTAQNPVHTYTQFNTYNVTLTVTTASGCTSTITKPVTVSTTTDLSANFTINDEVQCLAGNNFIFTDMSTMTTPNHHIDAWKWYFGDGDSAMTRNATHTYTQAGTYTVTLLVTEMPGGTQSSMPKTVKVLDLPVITDMAYIPPVCEGEYLQLQMPVIEWNGNNPVEGTWILGGYIFNPFTRTMTAADNGKLLQYSVVTPCGISTSAGVPVTVNTVAALTVDPIVNVCENDATAQLGCTLGGSQQGGILYNITFDANALSAGFTNIIGDTLTTNTITIPLPASLSSGIYSGTLTVVMTNGCVNTTAYQFHIQVNEGVRIIKQPESVRLCQDAGFTLSVMATGKNLTYQWYRNDEPIQGAIASTYMVSMSDSTVDYGTYYVEVTGLCGTVTSNVAEVGDGGFTLMLKWTDVIFISNQNNYFVGYQWYKDGKPIGKDGNYQSYVEQGGLNGTYYVVVTYADGTKEASCPYTVMKSKMRSVLVYPNPTHSYSEVTIDMRGYPLDVVDNSKFEIFDAQGRYVIGKTLREQVEKIQLDVAKGTYMYRITTTEDEVIVGKILVH
jgi:PKD repeat protein